MSTFKQLAEQVEFNLQGYTMDQQQRTFLAQDVNSSDTMFSVDEPNLLSQGIVQVEDELMWVKQVDNSASQVTVSPYGRGYRSSGAVSHAEGTEIMDNPKFPRMFTKQTINTAVRELYPDLYVVKSAEFNYVAARSTYPLPAEVDQVHRVKWQSIGPSMTWPDLKRWEFNPAADTTVFPTGKTVDLWEGIIPGRPVKVDYIVQPTVLVNDADDFATVTGFDLPIEEVVIYGACYRLSGWLEPPRLQTMTIESSQRAQLVPPGSATNVGKYFYGLYQQALLTQRTRLLREYPNSLHFRNV